TSTTGGITLSGMAGTATDDSATVTLSLWAGTDSGGTPRLTRTTTRNPSTGAFSVGVILPNAFWTVEARQSDASGITASYVTGGQVALSSGVLTITAADTVPPAAPTVDIVPLYINATNKGGVQITISGAVGTTLAGSVTSSGGPGSVALAGSLPNGSITQT